MSTERLYEFDVERSDLSESLRIEPGRVYRIGAASDCEIVLPTGPAVCAELSVQRVPEQKGARQTLRYVPVWTDGAGHQVADVDGATELHFGNTLELEGVVLTIRQAPTSEPRSFLRRLRALRERLLRPLMPSVGLTRPQLEMLQLARRSRYQPNVKQQDSLARMGAVVHESEAALVDDLFTRGARTTRKLFIIFVVATLLALYVAPRVPGGKIWIAAVLSYGALLLTMYTCTVCCSSIGAVVCALAGIAGVVVVAAPGSGENLPAIAAVVGVVWGAIGFMFERFWSPVPTEHEAAGLVFVAFLGGYAIHEVSGAVEGSLFVLIVVFVALVSLWTLFAVPVVRQRVLGVGSPPRTAFGRWLVAGFRERMSFDSTMLLQSVWVSWRRVWGARVMGVLFATVPILLVVHGTDLLDRLQSVEDVPGESRLWFWLERGEFVTSKHLEETGLYVLDEPALKTLGVTPKDGLAVIPRTAPVPFFSLWTSESPLATFAVRKTDSLDEALPQGSTTLKNVWSYLGPGVDPSGVIVDRVKRQHFWRTSSGNMAVRYRLVVFAVLPIAVLLTFFGLLILSRAAREGEVAIAGALWALGWSTVLCVAPLVDTIDFHLETMNPSLLCPLQLRDLLSALIQRAATSGLHTLLLVLAVLLGAAALILFGATLIGFVPAYLAAEWLGPADRRIWPVRARFIIGAAVTAIVVSHVVALASRFLPLFCATPFVVWLARWRLRRAGMPLRPAGLTHAVLLALPPCAYGLLGCYMDASRSPPLAAIITVAAAIVLVLFFAIGRIVLVTNQWNMAEGRTLPALASAIVLPVAFALFEEFAKDKLVQARLLPHNGGDVVALLLLGLFLHPAYKIAQGGTERLLLRKLGGFLKDVPGAVEGLMRSETDQERIRKVKVLLQDGPLKLDHYILYSRWTDPSGIFKPILHTFPGYSPPPLRITQRLLDELARDVTFIDVSMSLREMRFAVVAPELWRLQHRLGTEGPATAFRCSCLIPIVLGDTVCGLLVIGADKPVQSLRHELLARRLMQVGLAAS